MEWYKFHVETVNDPKLRLIADEVEQLTVVVLAIWITMMCHASSRLGAERGSLVGWHDRVAGVQLGIPPNVITRVRQAMQGLLLEGERLIDWERQQSFETEEEQVTSEREWAKRAKRAKASMAAQLAAAAKKAGLTDVSATGTPGGDKGQSRIGHAEREGADPPLAGARPAPALAAPTAAAPVPPAAPLSRAARRRAARNEQAAMGFPEWWDVYPLKLGYEAAAKAYAAAIGRGATPAELLTGLRNYRFDIRENGRFIPHPTAWLNGGNWANIDGISGLTRGGSGSVLVAAAPEDPRAATRDSRRL